VSRNIRILILAVVAVGAVGGYWKMVLSPRRAEIATLDQQVATQQAQLTQTQGLIATYKGARDAYEANYASVVRLGKAIPADDDTRSLMVQLDSAAKRSAVNFDVINVNGGGGGGAAPGATAPVNPIPGAVNAGAFSAMPFSLGFVGDFRTLGDFLSRIERFVTLKGDEIKVNGRLLRVENISLKAADTGWPELGVTIGASSYIVPEPDEAAAAAAAASTTTAPSGTTTATAPAAEGDSVQ
jgi:Tfp pilus assembly protein PilO